MNIRLPVTGVNRADGTVTVKADNESFVVNGVKWLMDCISVGDDALINKSTVTGEYVVVDYVVDTETNQVINQSYQEAHMESLIKGEQIQ